MAPNWVRRCRRKISQSWRNRRIWSRGRQSAYLMHALHRDSMRFTYARAPRAPCARQFRYKYLCFDADGGKLAGARPAIVKLRIGGGRGGYNAAWGSFCALNLTRRSVHSLPLVFNNRLTGWINAAGAVAQTIVRGCTDERRGEGVFLTGLPRMFADGSRLRI